MSVRSDEGGAAEDFQFRPFLEDNFYALIAD